MATLGTPVYYRDGESGASTCIGYESSKNRVVRFSFKTGSKGATSIKISVTAGTITNQGGADLTSIPFYVTTSKTSHKNANAASGSSVTGYINGSNGKAYSGSANVVLKADTTYYLWFFPKSETYGFSYWHNNSYYYTNATTEGTSKYKLTISAGTGSSITVNRTYSKVGLSTGNLSDDAVIYNGDKLKITFTAKTNYKLLTHTVNGSKFTSGNTKTVSGANVNVVSTAQVLASSVGATDANIGSTSTITVTRYNTSYYHTLQYTFGGLSGYITSDGNVQSSATRFKTSSIAFKIPESFYSEIPNSPTGTCTITCKTYANSTTTTQLGDSTTDKITITASKTKSSPVVSGSVVDTNETTIALTGDEHTLIKHKSNAKCTLISTPQKSATIKTTKINGTAITGTSNSNGVVTAEKTYAGVSTETFTFDATDSRGYPGSDSINPEIVNYIMLTCNPVIYREISTGNQISMDVSGNFYRGLLGSSSVYTNTLTLKYRYKKSGGSFPAKVQVLKDGTTTDANGWITIDPAEITLGTKTYKTTNTLLLQSYPETDDDGAIIYPGFDYQNDYVFEVRATDGAGEYVLTSVTKTQTVKKGIPIYDWGENDFNFNVPLMINNVNIFDIIFPIGAVYTHSSSTIPSIVKNLGTWTSVSTGISGIYAWKRTA